MKQVFVFLQRAIAPLQALLLSIVVSSAFAGLAEASDAVPLVLGVHPYLPQDEVLSRFTPLADYLTRSLGRKVNVRVGHDYDEHIREIGKDAIDIAYMGPVSYVKMVAEYGKKPLLARQVINNDPYLKGEIVVQRDSPLQSLSGLKGKCFVFGDPNSTMSSVLPRKMLENEGIGIKDLGRATVLEGHVNVALAVLAGDCDAGAVKDEVYQSFAPKGLRTLAKLPEVSDHLFVANSKLSPDLVAQLRNAFMELNRTHDGKAIMTSIHPHMTALVAPKDSDYDNLRALLYGKRSGPGH